MYDTFFQTADETTMRAVCAPDAPWYTGWREVSWPYFHIVVVVIDLTHAAQVQRK